MDNYSIAMQESYKIIKVMGNKYFMLIPEDIRNRIESIRDKNYNFEYDESKTLEEQNVQKETLDILSYLNLEYWCTPEEKEALLKIYRENNFKEEEQKRLKYNPDELFKGRETIKENIEEKALVDISKKENLWQKIIRKIKNIFSKSENI